MRTVVATLVILLLGVAASQAGDGGVSGGTSLSIYLPATAIAMLPQGIQANALSPVALQNDWTAGVTAMTQTKPLSGFLVRFNNQRLELKCDATLPSNPPSSNVQDTPASDTAIQSQVEIRDDDRCWTVVSFIRL